MLSIGFDTNKVVNEKGYVVAEFCGECHVAANMAQEYMLLYNGIHQCGTRLEPIRGQYLVLEDPSATKVGSFFLPDGSRQNLWRGQIVAMGPECGKSGRDQLTAALRNVIGQFEEGTTDSLGKAMDEAEALLRSAKCENGRGLHIGDRVFWAKYAGTRYEHQNTWYYLLEERDILGRIEGNPDIRPVLSKSAPIVVDDPEH